MSHPNCGLVMLRRHAIFLACIWSSHFLVCDINLQLFSLWEVRSPAGLWHTMLNLDRTVYGYREGIGIISLLKSMSMINQKDLVWGCVSQWKRMFLEMHNFNSTGNRFKIPFLFSVQKINDGLQALMQLDEYSWSQGKKGKLSKATEFRKKMFCSQNQNTNA